MYGNFITQPDGHMTAVAHFHSMFKRERETDQSAFQFSFMSHDFSKSSNLIGLPVSTHHNQEFRR